MTGLANEMTDEQILETLQMQGALDIQSSLVVEEKKIESVKIGPNIPTINISNITEKARAAMSEERLTQLEFFEACAVGDLVSKDPNKPTVTKFIQTGIDVRVQDNVAEMPLHKLARVRITDGNRQKFRDCLDAFIELIGQQAIAKGFDMRLDIVRAHTMHIE